MKGKYFDIISEPKRNLCDNTDRRKTWFYTIQEGEELNYFLEALK